MDKTEGNLVEYADKASVTSSFTNPRKAWRELLDSINNIYINFTKSQISPEELQNLLTQESNSTGIPNIASIEKIVSIMNRYITDYKISNATTLFLEFKRISAVYLFSIGSDKSIDYLKEILSAVEDSVGLDSNGDNLDVNMVCVKDCVKLNMAIIYFWLERFEESKDLLGEVITTYEVMDNELYLIKMVNFISVAFTYLAWIYVKQQQSEDAERAFLHAIKVLKIVKKHSKVLRKEQGFINIKNKKIFIYDQLLNFYAFTQKFENCQQPLREILKIMDKKSFNYDIDITPGHHANYYITATLYLLKSNNTIDFELALHYLSNVIKIIYKNSLELEPIPSVYYENIFILISCIKYNKNRNIFFKEIKKNREDKRFSDCNIIQSDLTEMEIRIRNIILFQIEKVSNYLDEIIGKFDSEKQFSLNPNGNNQLIDSLITLERFSEYVKNIKFSQFNFINDIQIRLKDENLLKKHDTQTDLDEIYLIKLTTEKMLFTYANLILNLNDCKTIHEKVVLEGLNGFLAIENEEIVLYVIYRFMARDEHHALHPQVKFQIEDDIKETKNVSDKKAETLKVFKIKNIEHDFAPLYFKRITYKLDKDAKTFNFPIYFALINVLYSKKLFQPCITLLSLMIDEISMISTDLYAQEQTSQKTQSFLHLYEFLLFIQVYLFIKLKQFDRALYELLKIKKNVSEVNELLYKTLIGLCLTHCFYFDIALMNFSDGIHLIKPLIDVYLVNSDVSISKKGSENKKNKNKSPELFLTEIRMFNSTLKCFSIETLNIIFENRMKICFRCRVEDNSINAICLNCNYALYCTKKCMRKNRILHENLCRFYTQNRRLINSFMDQLEETYRAYKDQMYRVEYRRNKDKYLLPPKK